MRYKLNIYLVLRQKLRVGIGEVSLNISILRKKKLVSIVN